MFPDDRSRSAALFRRAAASLPGGNSRHSVAIAPYPIYAASGSGFEVTDVDGATYVDAINNMSANIHGHRHPAVMEAIARQGERLVSVGLPTEVEIELAELLCARVPSVERVRFANSGTEALMFAVRAARAFTGRDGVAKIEGGYHGSYDALDLSNKPSPDVWGDGDAPATVREGQGFTAGAVADTLVLPVNRIEATRRLLEAHGERLAAVVIDPLVARMGFLPLTPEYLAMVREETARRGILLVFDEVFSFRLGPQGAQGEAGVAPDLSTFGKIIGGGLPIGAVGGRAEVMEVFSHLPGGKPRVEHSGTFNANPLSMAAGLVAMRRLDEAAFAHLATLGDRLRTGLSEVLRDLGMAGRAAGRGSLVSLVLHDRPVSDYRDFVAAIVGSGAMPRLAAYHREVVNRGVLPVFPSAFILSTPMTPEVVDRIVEASREALTAVRDAPALAA